MRASDPASIVQDVINAVNHGDLDEVMSFFDEGATLRIEPPLPGSPLQAYIGKELIQGLWRQLLEEHVEMRANRFQTKGNEVFWDSTIAADRFSEMGIGPVQAKGHAVVSSSLIESFTLTLDPASVRRMQEAMATQAR